MKAERQSIGKRRSRLVPRSALLLIVLCFVSTPITFWADAAKDTCDPNEGTCSDRGTANECKDLHKDCGEWTVRGECTNNARYMKKNCRLSCDLCQLDSGDLEYDDDTGLEDSSDDDEDEDSDDDDEYGDDEDDPSCEDKHRKCSAWADLGECTTNSRYMLSKCPRACGSCTRGGGLSDCRDRAEDEECSLTVARGDCLAEKEDTMKYCRKSCYHCISEDEAEKGGEEFIRKKRYAAMYLGPPQNIAGTTQERKEAKTNLRRVDQYLRDTVIGSDVTDEQRKKCRNLSAHCSFWAGRGRCEDKKDFMLRQCRLACLACTRT